MNSRPLLLAAALILVASPAVAARPAPDRFPLGVSAGSGAVCEAVRDDEDPAAQIRGARAWDVRCRGWDAALGRLYSYDWRGAEAIAPQGVWTRTLAEHAQCQPPAAAQVAGLRQTRRARCSAFSAKVAYLAYAGERGGRRVAAEGFANLDDVLQTGLRIAAGAAPPPKATQVLASTGAADAGGLAKATAAAAASPENLRERGYSRNLAWRFSDAETDFSALAQNGAASPQVRTEALLNWALNTSNVGRFNRADAIFAEAEASAGSDPALRGALLSYRALHLRNQRRFKEAIASAQDARRVLSRLAPGDAARGSSPMVEKDASGAVVIGAGAASALRSRTSFASANLDPGSRVDVQVAQTYLTQATAETALGETAEARTSLEKARALLSGFGLSRVAVWLRVQVESELARAEQAGGRPAVARARLSLALTQLRLTQAGSPAEAYLVLELARAEAVAGDQAAALRDFAQAVTLFKSSRGALGASADSADAYFDLLLARIHDDPARAQDYADRFLSAAESLGGEGTADTISRLSARLNQSDGATAGLIRALEDTRRQVRLKEAEIAELQERGAYPAAVRSVRQEELKSLSDQSQELEAKVAAADPRYGQLVTTTVSLNALQAKLKPGEVFVKTILLDQAAYGLAVGHDWVEPYRIASTRAKAEDAVSTLRRPFETEGRLPSYDVKASHVFFETMFGPVRERLIAASHVIYEPDPGTLSLPIAALAVDEKSAELIAGRRAAIRAKGEGVLSYDGVAWLGRTADTSLVVSAASFVQARGAPASPASRPFLGFGASIQPSGSDPHAFASVVNHEGTGDAAIENEVCHATRVALLGLKPLREATQELQSVGASLGAGPNADVVGQAFSDGDLARRPDLDQYRVLYFATHGLLPRPGGCLPEPSLLTSVDDATPGSDGLLTATDILGLKLNADLVVLSACDTGGAVEGELDRSGLGGSGEALGGLTRAFIYAGARSLIVSHWQIDSAATVRLMTTMFQAKAASLGDGLRAAETQLMASPDQYSHPYYWAAFTIVGDAARPMPAS